MKKLKALILMQLKDKMNLSYELSKKTILRKIIPNIFKIVLVTGISYLLCMLCGLFSIFSLNNFVPLEVMGIALLMILLLSTFTCTNSLTHTLYYAEDNKVLITYPVSSSMIFLSKIIVYYLNELGRSIFFTIPIFIGYGIFSKVGVSYYFIMPLMFIFISAIPVCLGMILSIPAYYIISFLNKFGLIKTFLGICLIIGAVLLAVYLISLIPPTLNIVYLWPKIYRVITGVLDFFRAYMLFAYFLVIMAVGYPVGLKFDYWNPTGWYTLIVVVGSIAILTLITFYAIKPFFLKMCSKSFETNKSKNISTSKNNHKLNPFISCFKKEVILATRGGSYYTTLLATYIMTPLIVLLLAKVFASLEIGHTGKLMACGFTLLFIMLPIFASDSIFATIYSREGRVFTIQRTNPINPLIPLITKLIIPTILSIISISVCMVIFADTVKEFNYFNTNDIVLMAFGIIFVQVGLVIWSALSDIQNPKIEEYATSGEDFNNKNEIKMIVIAFLLSFGLAFFSYVLINENPNKEYWTGLKILLIGILFVIASGYMFYREIKCFYNDNEIRRIK